MLPATIAICRKLCSLQAKQKRCSDLNFGENKSGVLHEKQIYQTTYIISETVKEMGLE